MERTNAIEKFNKKHILKGFEKYRNLIGIICMVVLAPLIIFNFAVLIASFATDGAPSFFGVTPILQLSSAMDGSGIAEKGDMVFIKKTDTSILQVGDVIGYRIGETVYIRRIVAMSVNGDNENVFITKGDTKLRRDNANVKENQIIGLVSVSVKNLGSIVEFAQSPFGIALFVGFPIAAYLTYNIFTSIMFNRKLKKNSEEKLLDEKSKETDDKLNDQNANEENKEENSLKTNTQTTIKLTA